MSPAADRFWSPAAQFDESDLAMTEPAHPLEKAIALPGCIWLFCFDGQGAGRPGTSADLARIDAPDHGHVWLHLDNVDRRTTDLLAGLAILPDEARATLDGDRQHQFVERGNEVMFGQILDHEYAYEGPRETCDQLCFAMGPGFLITSRRHAVSAIDATRRALEGGALARDPVALFELLLSQSCKGSAFWLNDIAGALDEIEDKVVIDELGRSQRGPLGLTRRRLVRLTRQIGGLRSTIQRYGQAAAEAEDERLIESGAALGQLANSLLRETVSLQDRARTLQEEINAILATETNDRLFTLTVLTAILLPATLVTGYFGMNTKNLPFADVEEGTIYASIICGLASLTALLVLRRLGLTSANAERKGARRR